MLLHEKIRKVREFKDLSQHYVASRLKVTQEAYSNWEKGTTRLTLDKLRAIADVLETDPIVIINLQESSLYLSLHGKVADSPDDGRLEQPAGELTPGERYLYEQRIKEVQDAYRWQRQQNELLTTQLTLLLAQHPNQPLPDFG